MSDTEKPLVKKEALTVPLPLRITPTMGRVIDAMRGPTPRSEFVRDLVRAEYVRRVKYQGMAEIKREQGGADAGS
jgi:hypothetical protein